LPGVVLALCFFIFVYVNGNNNMKFGVISAPDAVLFIATILFGVTQFMDCVVLKLN
jgi:hypothetical protein